MRPLIYAMVLAALAAGAPAQGQSGPTWAMPLPALITNHDYPAEALRKGEEGRVRFRLDIDARGRVTRCTIVASSGSASLDSTSCRIMTSRARFVAAKDAAGQPVAATILHSIDWRIAESSGGSQRLNDLMQLWVTCIMGEAAKLSVSTVVPEEAPERAYSACAVMEPMLEGEFRASAFSDPLVNDPVAGMKEVIGPSIVDQVRRAREAFQQPVEPD